MTAFGPAPHDERVLAVVLVAMADAGEPTPRIDVIRPNTPEWERFWADLGRPDSGHNGTRGVPDPDECVQPACPTCPKCHGTGMIPDPDRGSGNGPYWDDPCDCPAGRQKFAEADAHRCECSTCAARRERSEQPEPVAETWCPLHFEHWDTSPCGCDPSTFVFRDGPRKGLRPEECGHCAERIGGGCPPPDTLPCIGCPRVRTFVPEPVATGEPHCPLCIGHEGCPPGGHFRKPEPVAKSPEPAFDPGDACPYATPCIDRCHLTAHKDCDPCVPKPEPVAEVRFGLSGLTIAGCAHAHRGVMYADCPKDIHGSEGDRCEACPRGGH